MANFADGGKTIIVSARSGTADSADAGTGPRNLDSDNAEQ